MRSVLVCVRTPLAAQTVASWAVRLGLGGAIRTAVTGADALARLAEAPADLILADTALTKPDTVGFTQRVQERSPGAVLVLFGPEEPLVAQGAIAAGARGVIRGDQEDLVTSVTKALLLVAQPVRPPVPSQRIDAAAPGADHDDGSTGHGREADEAGTAATVPAGPLATSTPGARATGRGASSRLALTKREVQVLLGMTEGKSNAEIGRDLFVSEDTVKTHARRLFRKLGVRDRAHAVAAAFRAGLVN